MIEIGFEGVMFNKERLLQLFIELCAIPSESRQERSIAEVIASIARSFVCEVWFDDAASKIEGNSGNLYFRYPGTVDAATILLNAHMDTVPVKEGIVPIIKEDIITAEGNTILGADDKAGVAVIIEAIRTIIEKNLPCPPIEVVLTVGEEKGLLGAKYINYSMLKAKMGICLDGEEIDKVVIAAPSQHTIKVNIKGRAAHAAMNPEHGLNAIFIASRAISSLPWGRLDNETTSNVGVISGGVATNIVPDEVKVDIELRSLNSKKLHDYTSQIEKVFNDTVGSFYLNHNGEEHRAKLEFRVFDEYHSFRIGEIHPLIVALKEAGTKQGIDILPISIGGGSDANIFNQNGIESVLMGIGMEKYHTPEEFIKLSGLYRAESLLINTLIALAKPK